MSNGVRPRRNGRYEIRIGKAERELLRSLVVQMRALLEERADPDDAVIGRLFPVAYPDERDEDRQTEYRLLVHDELRSSLRTALGVLEKSLSTKSLDESRMVSSMRAINSLRLVLGAKLGVTEEGDERPTTDDDPRTGVFAVYDFLTWLQGEMLEALAS
ncbi:MAG: DUF2017 family protein [Acidimicrobiales bacterium]